MSQEYWTLLWGYECSVRVHNVYRYSRIFLGRGINEGAPHLSDKCKASFRLLNGY